MFMESLCMLLQQSIACCCGCGWVEVHLLLLLLLLGFEVQQFLLLQLQ